LWIALAAVACTAVYSLRIASRGELLWDEAFRILAGQQLAFLLQRGDLLGAWQWLNNQTFYPFLLPAFHGLLLLAGLSPTDVAWLPSLLAYGASGILAGVLVRWMGGSRWGAVVAGVGVWSIPQLASLSAGAYTEPFGVLVYLCILLAITRLLQQPGRWSVTALTGVEVVAFWIKLDYAFFGLIAIALTGLLALPSAANSRRRHFMVVLLASVTAEAIGVSFNLGPKLSGMYSFFTQADSGSALRHSLTSRDPLFYIHSLLGDPALGTGLLVGAALLTSTAFAAARAYRERLLVAPLLLVVMPLAAYSASSIQFTRYLLPAIAVQFVLAGWLASKIPAGWLARTAIAAVGLVLLASEIPGYLAGDPLFVSSPVARQALGEIVQVVSGGDRRILFLRPLNEVSPPLVELSLDRREGRTLRPVFYQTPWTPAQSGGLEQMLAEACPYEVAAVEVDPGSSLDTVDYRLAWSASAPYLQQAADLEAAGALVLRRSVSLEHGLAHVWVWSVAPGRFAC
jgi:hypothetical protein